MIIDFVVSWVNGNDPVHKESRLKFPPDDSVKQNSQIVGDVRFVESGEIYYCISSVLKYAPFIRRIFIVTDNQIPVYLDDFFNENKCNRNFIKIISHDDIFHGLQASRPNFNSLSIESVLWRIPGLSEHFIYANDDFFFNSPVCESDFFHDGKPVLRGKWNKPEQKRLKNIIRRNLRKLTGRGPNTNPTFRKSLDRGAVIAGSTNGFLAIGHHPHPLRKSTFQNFFRQKPELLNRQVRHRYRNVDQFNPVSLGNHLEILHNHVPFQRPLNSTYIDPNKRINFSKKTTEIVNDETHFGCIQSIENIPGIEASLLHKILCTKFKETLPVRIRNILSLGIVDTGQNLYAEQRENLGLAQPITSEK